MSLSPINLYQQQQNPLAQILAGGNQTITGIFDRAIQIGRDMSNKQLQQEQDMLAMRQQETNMAQRRAENLQQNNEDAIRFARSAFESDRKFGVDQTQQTFQNNRVTAQDLFSNTDSTRRTDLAKQGLDLQTAKFEADKAQVKQARTDAQVAAETRNAEVASLYAPKPTVLQGPTRDGSPLLAPLPKESVDQAQGQIAAIEARLGDKNLTAEQIANLAANRSRLLGLYPDSGGKPPSQLQLDAATRAQGSADRAQKSADRAEATDERGRLEKELGIGLTPQAFPLHGETNTDGTENKTTKARNARQFAEELNFASNTTEDDFAVGGPTKNIPQTPEVIAARRAWYKKARRFKELLGGEGQSDPQAGAPSSAAGSYVNGAELDD